MATVQHSSAGEKCLQESDTSYSCGVREMFCSPGEGGGHETKQVGRWR